MSSQGSDCNVHMKGSPYSVFSRYLRSQLCSLIPREQRLEDEHVPSHIVPNVLEGMGPSDREHYTGSLLGSQGIARMRYRIHGSSDRLEVYPAISSDLAAKCCATDLPISFKDWPCTEKRDSPSSGSYICNRTNVFDWN